MINIEELLTKENAFRKTNGIKVSPLPDKRLILFHLGWSATRQKNPYAPFKKELGPHKMALSVVNSKDIKALGGDVSPFVEGINYAAIDIRMLL